MRVAPCQRLESAHMPMCADVEGAWGRRVLSVDPARFEVRLTTASEALRDQHSHWEDVYCGHEVPFQAAL